ncbi:MAG TPA: hypothetical protein VEU96_29500 [Bryobacteraceae bacterium]|nr:hypothetical protein [Bryobacteraceae bacterium]
MELHESECPLCLGHMQREEREGTAWLFCPNGCPTEYEAPIRKPAAVEAGMPEPALQARAAGS